MNTPQHQQPYLAWRTEPEHSALLSDPARELQETLRAAIRAVWEDPEQRATAARAAGCLDKLQSTLLQARRLRTHHDGLLERATTSQMPAGSYLALRGDEACADFESLLFHGRAALDRTAWFATNELGSRTSSYRRFGNVLGNFPNDERAMRLLPVILEAEAWINRTYAQLDEADALRDLVGHKVAITEGMRACFGVLATSDGRALALDCEFAFTPDGQPIGLFDTAADAAQQISFVLLNALACFLGREGLAFDACASAWTPRTVRVSQYVLHEEDGAALGENWIRYASRMLPSGFEMEARNVNADLWDQAIPVEPQTTAQGSEASAQGDAAGAAII